MDELVDSNDESSDFDILKTDQPVRPIDPIAWVEHTRQVNRNSKGNLVYFFKFILNYIKSY